MSKIQITAFCVFSLTVTLAISFYLYPLAAMPKEAALKARQPAEMDEFDLIDLGEDYGQLTIYDLIGFYMDNPPATAAGDSTPKKKHFGGC